MIGDAVKQVIRYANIQHVAFDVRQQVDVIRVHAPIKVPRFARDDTGGTTQSRFYLVTMP